MKPQYPIKNARHRRYMITLCRAMLMALLLFQLACGRTGLTEPEVVGGDARNCCRELTEFGPIQIAASADQVPVELQKCGSNKEEITAIAIRGKLSGCAERGDMTFSDLQIDFTTEGTVRCGGQGMRTSIVYLNNVSYSSTPRLAQTPPCVANSAVTRFGITRIDDVGFHTLFTLNGGDTLRPILNNLLLRWASSPQGTCPPSPVLGTSPGNTSACPR